MTTLQQAAYQYAKLGWCIFPITPGSKKPFPGSNGFKDATNDLSKVAETWAKYPNANIGLATGKASGVYIVDIDIDKIKGKNGFVTLSEMGIALPGTIHQSTPRGGRHLFFTSESEIRNGVEVLSGVDIRGDGGYLVLAPSVLTDGTCYKWDEILHPWNASAIPYPDNFPREREKPRHDVPAPVIDKPSAHTPEDLRRRIEAYIEKISPAVQGSRGHDCLLWFFQCTINGMCLSKSEAISYGWSHFNPRCDPPWDAAVPKEYWEFTRKADQAEKNPTRKFPRGWIRDDPEFNMPVAPDGFDLKLFIERKKREANSEDWIDSAFSKADTDNKTFGIGYWLKEKGVEREKKESDEELKYLCQPHGLVGDVVSYINSRAVYPQPFLAVAASLAFLGAVFGRKVRDEMGLRTNIYTLGIGPSSSGKNNALTAIRQIATHTGHFDIIGGDEVTSSAAIETHVYSNQSTIFLWDEIGFMFKGTKSGNEHKAGVIPFLMKLYSLAGEIYKGRSYAEADKQRVIVQPCVSFYGTSTIERFKEGVSFEELDDGWIARVLMFSADPNPEFRQATISPPPDRLVEDLKAWKKRSVPNMENEDEIASFIQAPAGSHGDPIPIPVVYETSEDASKEFAVLRNFSREFNGAYKTLWLKSEELARRYALILAAGRNFENRTIDKIDAKYACVLVSRCVKDFTSGVANDVGNDLYFKRLVKTRDAIKNAGIEGIKRSKLSSRCSRWAREFPGIVKHLLESHEVFQLQVDRMQVFWSIEYEEEVMSACQQQKNS